MTQNHSKSAPFSGWLTLLLLLATNTASAQELYYESEPNNTPAEANVVSGEVNLAGTMSGSDQDGFMWSVSDADAEKQWTFRLDGIPGKLTILQVFRVEFAENGVDVVGKQKLFGMGTRDGAKPAIQRDLMFEPGDYVLGFAYGGGGSGSYRPPTASIDFGDAPADSDANADQAVNGYRAQISSDGLNVRTPSNPPEDQENALNLRPGGLLATFVAAEQSWYRLSLNEGQASSLWEVRGQLPVGQHAEVYLRDSGGAEITASETDDFGRFLFTDLGLSPGDHFLEIRGEQANIIHVVSSAAVGERVAGGEAEENGSWANANIIDPAIPVQGRFGVNNDSDYYRFTLDEKAADQVLDLKLDTGPNLRTTLCLLDATGQTVQCRNGQGPVALPKLVLQPGDWGALINRGAEGTEYTLSLQSSGAIEPDTEVEPNDEVALAVSMPSRNRVRGRIDTEKDTDYFRFLVTDEAQLWRFQAIGDGLQRITYYDGSGRSGKTLRENARRLRLENLFLMPGQHFIAIDGAPGTEYTLLARPLGRPDPDGEFEPNDDPSRSQPLQLGQRRNGLLPNTSDKDFYRFTLHDWERLRLTIEPAADGSIQLHHYWEYPDYFYRPTTGVGEALVLEGLYPPGVHVLSLVAKQPSEAEYHVQVERLDRFGCPTDCEPNADKALASAVPPSMVLEGSTTAWNGNDPNDIYALPRLDEDQELVIRADEQYQLSVTADHGSDNLVAWDETLGAFKGVLPGGSLTYLEIKGANERYRMTLEYADGPEPITDGDTPSMDLALELDTKRVRAYRDYGQRLTGQLQARNLGTEPVSLTLKVATSDRRWTVDLEREAIDLAAGDAASVPLVVHVPDDAWAGRDVRVSVYAGNRSGGVSTHADIAVDPMAEPVDPIHHYSLPEPLLGGFNAAASVFGGTFVGENDGYRASHKQQAIDGIAVPGNGVSLRGGYKGDRVELVYDLAGEEAIEISGIVLNSIGGGHKRAYLRIADVSVSLDGEQWQRVLFAPLDPVNGEQAFVLDSPVATRYIRVVPEHNWLGKARRGENIGEIKAIASPGFDLSGGRGFNIASRELGGRVVWSRPHIDAGWGNAILHEEDRDPAIRMKAGDSLSWVIGFHHDRAALLDRLEWVHKPPGHQLSSFEKVQVSASMASPLGPWTPVGEWVLSGAQGETDLFDPEQPFWARYLKFTTPPAAQGGPRALPTPLRAWEVPTSPDYRSIVAEWGELSREAFWESTQPVPIDPPFERAGHDARERAKPLAPGQEASGAVLLAEHEHWYRLEVPAGQNTLTISLTGHPTVRTAVNVETEAGKPVVLRRIDQRTAPYEQVFEAVVDPGSVVYLQVEEPPRSVVFAWDTSPSVAPFITVIYQALLEYSRQVRPGLDAVNMMPFGRGLLLKEWFSEPFILQTVVNEYPRRESSSLAETTLTRASRALAPRPGSKAVLLITDAFTPRYRGGLWDALEDARPRVFGLGVNIVGSGSDGSLADVNHAYDLMQGWSAVNGGLFTQLLTLGELEVAFDRAQTLLREPAPYVLNVAAEFREAPGPGTLTVEPGSENGQSVNRAVELILDASGSMLKRQEGTRRIAIAREVLTEAVTDWIPEGTPVALRVFGHREPNACRTDLEVPLAPLDRKAMAATISNVNAMNLAKTPIADSLAAAADDLSGVDGSVSILLLTDGEETCEGDPAEAIAKLEEAGIDVTLNIVGFAIGDEQTEALFTEWAELGGGRYFSAANQEGLANAVNTALQVPFTVYDHAGSRVIEGVVGGDPVKLEAGVYRVVVKGSESRVFENVQVPGETRISLDLDDAR